MNALFLTLLLAVPAPPDIDAAIRGYYRQKEHEATQEAARARESPFRSPAASLAPPGAVGAFPVLFALLRPGTTTPLTEARAGEALVLLGADLPPDGRVFIAQREATITRRTATFYELLAPSQTGPTDPRPLTGPVDLFVGNQHLVRLTSSFTLLLQPPEPLVMIRARVTGAGAMALNPGAILQATGTGLILSLTLTEVQVGPTPTPPPPPPPSPVEPDQSWLGPHILHVRGGVSGRATAPLPGDTVIVTGSGFGSVRGRLWWGAVEVTPFAWSDREVRFWMPLMAGGLQARGIQVSVRTAGGKGASVGAFITP